VSRWTWLCRALERRGIRGGALVRREALSFEQQLEQRLFWSKFAPP